VGRDTGTTGVNTGKQTEANSLQRLKCVVVIKITGLVGTKARGVVGEPFAKLDRRTKK
jgi:hypothetical protein